MKDAFGKELSIGDKIIYSTSNSNGTTYHIGEIIKFHENKNEHKWNPDKATVKILKSDSKFSKDPIVYCSNIVCLPVDDEENELLKLAIEEARRCRDNARNEAIEHVQKEMAELRLENAKLKKTINFGLKTLREQ